MKDSGGIAFFPPKSGIFSPFFPLLTVPTRPRNVRGRDGFLPIPGCHYLMVSAFLHRVIMLNLHLLGLRFSKGFLHMQKSGHQSFTAENRRNRLATILIPWRRENYLPAIFFTNGGNHGF